MLICLSVCLAGWLAACCVYLLEHLLIYYIQVLCEKLRTELRAERMHSLRLEIWIAALHDEVNNNKPGVNVFVRLKCFFIFSWSARARVFSCLLFLTEVQDYMLFTRGSTQTCASLLGGVARIYPGMRALVIIWVYTLVVGVGGEDLSDQPNAL